MFRHSGMAEGIYRIADGWCLGANSVLLGSREGFRIEIPEYSYVEQAMSRRSIIWCGWGLARIFRGHKSPGRTRK